MSKNLTRFSIALNVILLGGFLITALIKREWILNKLYPYRNYPVIMLGSSFTGGCDWNKELNRSDIKNDGVGGASTFNYIMYMFEDVIKRKPKICFIDGGLNDIDFGIPLSRTYENYNIIVDTLKKYNIIPVLQSTFYCHHPNDSMENANVDSINNFLVKLAQKKGLRYVDVNQYFARDGRLKKEFTSDGYHLTAPANKIWAREVKIVLDEEKI